MLGKGKKNTWKMPPSLEVKISWWESLFTTFDQEYYATFFRVRDSDKRDSNTMGRLVNGINLYTPCNMRTIKTHHLSIEMIKSRTNSFNNSRAQGIQWLKIPDIIFWHLHEYGVVRTLKSKGCRSPDQQLRGQESILFSIWRFLDSPYRPVIFITVVYR